MKLFESDGPAVTVEPEVTVGTAWPAAEEGPSRPLLIMCPAADFESESHMAAAPGRHRTVKWTLANSAEDTRRLRPHKNSAGCQSVAEPEGYCDARQKCAGA